MCVKEHEVAFCMKEHEVAFCMKEHEVAFCMKEHEVACSVSFEIAGCGRFYADYAALSLSVNFIVTTKAISRILLIV